MSERPVLDRSRVERRATLKLVDCDIHPMPATPAELDSYLSPKWREYVARYGNRSPFTPNYLRPNGGARRDSWPPGGGFAGSNLELLRSQLLDEYSVDYGVLTVYNFYDRNVAPFAADGARATNDWFVDRWLDPEPRLVAGISVPWEHPELAIREIERRAADTRFVYVSMPAEPQEPLGSRRYWPTFEAATAAGLPLAMHAIGYDLHHAAGWSSYYFEEHSCYAFAAQRQLLSLICEGVFEAFPGIRIILVEGGVTWKASLCWALDSAFELLGDELDLSRRPSEYIDESVWFTTQPIEEPDDPAQLEQIIAHGRLANRLLFSTDYPHWDFDSPTQALPRTLPPELRQRILVGNAADLYRLPR